MCIACACASSCDHVHEDHELNNCSKQGECQLEELEQSEELPSCCSILKDLTNPIKPAIKTDDDDESKPPSYHWFPMSVVSFADVMATRQNTASKKLLTTTL